MLKTLTGCLREYRRDAILTPVYVTCEVLLECLIPLIMARLIDGLNGGALRPVLLRGALLTALAFLSLFFGVLSSRTAARASAGLAKNLRRDLFFLVQDFDFADIDLFSSSSLITRLPDGYQTMLRNGGSRLSQGQRQLISIARAAVADPPVMILDEATSSIDTRTESLVQAGMDNLMKGRTVFVIAHRLSTVKNSDTIMVLEHGRIIEHGSHDELMALKGSYYQLYTGSFELP